MPKDVMQHNEVAGENFTYYNQAAKNHTIFINLCIIS